MSLEFARLDMSKPCDSHAIVMRKELRGPRCPEPRCRALARKRKLGECGVTGRPRRFRVNATKSRRWWPRERLSMVPCSEPHSRRSSGDPSAEARTRQFSGTVVRSQRMGRRKIASSRDGLRSAPQNSRPHQSSVSTQTNTCLSAWAEPWRRSNDTDPPVVHPTGLRNSCQPKWCCHDVPCRLPLRSRS